MICFFQFILIVLQLYMFLRLIGCLKQKGILKDIDIFFITSNPWEYKKHKNIFEKNHEGS